MKSSNVLLGILGGLAAGAIAGVLFAPDKGSKTKKIKKKAQGLKSELRDEFEVFLDKMEDKYQTINEKANEIVDTVKK